MQDKSLRIEDNFHFTQYLTNIDSDYRKSGCRKQYLTFIININQFPQAVVNIYKYILRLLHILYTHHNIFPTLFVKQFLKHLKNSQQSQGIVPNLAYITVLQKVFKIGIFYICGKTRVFCYRKKLFWRLGESLCHQVYQHLFYEQYNPLKLNISCCDLYRFTAEFIQLIKRRLNTYNVMT